MLSIYQLIFSLIYWYIVLVISLFWKTYLGQKVCIYSISSPISRAIFQYLTQKFWRFFHKKRGSAYSRGFRILSLKITSKAAFIFVF